MPRRLSVTNRTDKRHRPDIHIAPSARVMRAHEMPGKKAQGFSTATLSKIANPPRIDSWWTLLEKQTCCVVVFAWTEWGFVPSMSAGKGGWVGDRGSVDLRFAIRIANRVSFLRCKF